MRKYFGVFLGLGLVFATLAVKADEDVLDEQSPSTQLKLGNDGKEAVTVKKGQTRVQRCIDYDYAIVREGIDGKFYMGTPAVAGPDKGKVTYNVMRLGADNSGSDKKDAISAARGFLEYRNTHNTHLDREGVPRRNTNPTAK